MSAVVEVVDVELDRFGRRSNSSSSRSSVRVSSSRSILLVVDVELDRFGRTSARRVRNRGSRRSLSQGFK